MFGEGSLRRKRRRGQPRLTGDPQSNESRVSVTHRDDAKQKCCSEAEDEVGEEEDGKEDGWR